MTGCYGRYGDTPFRNRRPFRFEVPFPRTQYRNRCRRRLAWPCAPLVLSALPARSPCRLPIRTPCALLLTQHGSGRAHRATRHACPTPRDDCPTPGDVTQGDGLLHSRCRDSLIRCILATVHPKLALTVWLIVLHSPSAIALGPPTTRSSVARFTLKHPCPTQSLALWAPAAASQRTIATMLRPHRLAHSHTPLCSADLVRNYPQT